MIFEHKFRRTELVKMKIFEFCYRDSTKQLKEISNELNPYSVRIVELTSWYESSRNELKSKHSKRRKSRLSEQKSMNENFKKIAENSAVRRNDAETFAESENENVSNAHANMWKIIEMRIE